MLYVTLQHETRPRLRAFIVATEEEVPIVKHFYLEQLKVMSWMRSRKIDGERFNMWMARLGFDPVEAAFLLEEAYEKLEHT